jgi:hypothetical protein
LVKNLAESDDAVNAWYAGASEYDAKVGAPKDPKNKEKKTLSDNYTTLVWKSSTRTGFGIKGKVVVAWICNEPGNQPYEKSVFLKNVS